MGRKYLFLLCTREFLRHANLFSVLFLSVVIKLCWEPVDSVFCRHTWQNFCARFKAANYETLHFGRYNFKKNSAAREWWRFVTFFPFLLCVLLFCKALEIFMQVFASC